MAEDVAHGAFFYGTLMAPQVLHRVCHGSSDPSNPLFALHNLKSRPAILHGHRRHRVKQADYPAVIPKQGSTVRGTFVSGLTDADLWRLDIFEGSEYSRRKVSVKLLDQIGDDSGKGNVEGETVEVETYIWIAGEDRLEQSEWDFAQFQREKMRFWVGAGGEAAGEYAEVDEAVAKHDGTGGRGANGHISQALESSSKNEAIRNAV